VFGHTRNSGNTRTAGETRRDGARRARTAARRGGFARLVFAACLLCIATHPASARADAYPSRAIRFVVPFPAGGGIDALARLVGARLGDALGQAVVVENHPGATGNRGNELVAKAAPDGYTLVVAANSMTVNPSMPGMRAPDPATAFAPVTKLVTIPIVVAVAPSFAARSLDELLALARASPRRLAYANQGIGSTSHLAAVLLSLRAGVELLQIPYSGLGLVVKDVLTGEIPIVFSSTGTVTPFVRSGQLRALAVTGSRRSSALPDVPTVAESGFPGFEVTSWYGVLAPAGTPPEIVLRLRDELTRVLAQADVRESLARLGMQPVGNTPAQFAAEIGADVARWARVVREARIGVE
jgi:tripartite-type tricarboxylate transporter receptor subunit TctC